MDAVCHDWVLDTPSDFHPLSHKDHAFSRLGRYLSMVHRTAAMPTSSRYSSRNSLKVLARAQSS